MRPVKLEISGLNSFRGREVIDFGPLMKDGLFGIFGPTGSGKSTILDGITLALYGKVKRAPQGKNGIINAREERCIVSLHFDVGVEEERRSYIVERNLTLSKTEGVVTKKARLIEVRPDGSMPIAEKQGEVNSRVEEILGINFDDFLRAVVLPQGSFAEFLGLPPAERSRVLQRLFSLQDLGQRLAIKLKHEIATLRTSRAGIDGRLMELRVHDDAALERSLVAHTEALAESEEARRLFESADRVYRDGMQLLELVEELEKLREEELASGERTTRLEKLHAEIDAGERSSAVEPLIAAHDRTVARRLRASEEMQKATAEEKNANAAFAEAAKLLAERHAEHESCYDLICSQLNILHQIEEERKDLAVKRERLRRLDESIVALDGTIVIQSEERSALALEVETIGTALTGMEEELKSALLSTADRETLDTLRRRQQDLKRLATSIADREKSEATLVASIARRQADLDAAVVAERSALQEIARLRMEADTLRGGDEQVELAIGTLREKYQKQKQVLDELLRAEEKRDALRTELATEAAAIAHYTDEQKQVTLEIDAALEAERIAREHHANVMERRERSRNLLAVASLLHTLKDGEPCPLCGALDHPAPYSAEPDGGGADLDRSLSEADRMLRDAAEQKAYSSQKMAAVQVQLQIGQERSAVASGALAIVTRDIAALLSGIESSGLVESTDDLKIRVEGIKEEGRKKVVEQKELRERAKRNADELAALTEKRNHAAQQISALEAGRSAQEVQLAEARAWLQQLRSERGEALEGISAGQDGVTIEWIDAEVAGLLERERLSEDLRGRIAAATTGLRSQRDAFDLAERELAGVTSRREREIGIRDELHKEIAAITEKLRERHATVIEEGEHGMLIPELIARREERRDEVRRSYDAAQAAHRSATVRVEVAASAVERGTRSFEQESLELATALEEMRKGLMEHRFESAEEARSMLIEAPRLNRLRAEAREITQNLVTLQERLREVASRIGERTITREEATHLQEERNAASRRNDEAIQRTGAAGSELEKCRQGNAAWHTLVREESETIARAESAEQLQRYLQGDAFVAYLADERLGDICRRATAQLRVLTNGCYELRTRPSDGFYIIDNGNGGGERAPSSLSGGETFLVSLSLALALSDMVQMGRAPLEFFFLDEGFGTLDSDLLDTVMNSLEQLRSQHRTIGVITHVTALRERISRRLNVHPATEIAGSRVEFEVV